ncbi:MAG: AraC family transcriptional regulator [Nostoc sp.]|uniref:helix-turn-helix transcriptional regulator n=1 Tax=Nostoc sp. TaxID=1180 RepID=UPI002FF7FBD7
MDILWQHPPRLGEGQSRFIKLREGLELCISNYQLHDTVITKVKEREHHLEYGFVFSGVAETRHMCKESSMTFSAGKYFFTGSGVAPKEIEEFSARQPHLCLGVHMTPELFRSFAGDPSGELPISLNHLIRKPSQEYYTRVGTTTLTMQITLQKILGCPHQGLLKRMYLESKTLELMALIIEQELEMQEGRQHLGTLKPEDFDRIHHARDILLENLHNPLSLRELARRVNLNDFTLKQGFRQIFGTTVFSYLRNYCLEQARQLLKTGEMNITEVAQAVGYTDRSPFALAFRKHFGSNPKEYQKQRKNSL